jgi:hypothetical protein
LPCGAAARIGRDPGVGRAPEVIMNNGHGFSSRMRYARKKTPEAVRAAGGQ